MLVIRARNRCVTDVLPALTLGTRSCGHASSLATMTSWGFEKTLRRRTVGGLQCPLLCPEALVGHAPVPHHRVSVVLDLWYLPELASAPRTPELGCPRRPQPTDSRFATYNRQETGADPSARSPCLKILSTGSATLTRDAARLPDLELFGPQYFVVGSGTEQTAAVEEIIGAISEALEELVVLCKSADRLLVLVAGTSRRWYSTWSRHATLVAARVAVYFRHAARAAQRTPHSQAQRACVLRPRRAPAQPAGRRRRAQL